MNAPDIYTYFDYRTYLADYYAFAKSNDPAFSHRVFLKKAGIPGTIYLHRVINRQRKLSPKYVDSFIGALELGPRQSRYFRTLVIYGNTRLISEKEPLLRELMELRAQDNELSLQNNQLNFFSKWYYPVILELLTVEAFTGDYKRLANQVIPRISPAQAAGAIRFLLKNDFLKKTEDGNLVPNNPNISTGPEARSTILAHFHRQNLQWCADSLSEVESTERDISSLTLGISYTTYQIVKKEIQDFRRRLMKLAEEDQRAEMVAHVGFQLMPRTKVSKKR
jgi:uncharacterized protein (TIGR02147 family)